MRALVPYEEFEIGCHQVRITADDTANGYPTPEGFHQDGFAHVAVTCINQHNVNGGVSLVALAQDEDEIVFEGSLVPGGTMIIDDTAVKHYVSPITPKLPGGNAYRDVVVVAFAELAG